MDGSSNFFCVAAIFKNEAEILEEWINHYINEGCQHFFLIDNGSTDNYLPIINKYNRYIDLVIDGARGRDQQKFLYNKYFLSKIKIYTWTLICDLDEFMYARNGFITITQFLNTVENYVSQIAIPWKMFGSNGYNILEKKEPKSVIQSFYKRAESATNQEEFTSNEIICKCIIRSSTIIKLGIHIHEVKPTRSAQNLSIYPTPPVNPHQKVTILSNYNIIENKSCNHMLTINENILKADNLHLNHYILRSLDWYTRIKVTRGDSMFTNNHRNTEHFLDQDRKFNKIIDIELKNKTY
jgi:hypothetical protein